METRKLQEVGGGTFTVSIPKEWATTHGFEVGMELQLYTHRDGSILVRTSKADIDRLNEATIDVGDGGPGAVSHAVRTAHAVGFETIILRPAGSFSDDEREAVRSTVRELVGTNVISESAAEITVRHLLDTSSVSVRQSIAQLQYVAVPLLRDAVETFVGAVDGHARIRERAHEARRSAEMVTRHFSRSLVSHAELDALGVSRSELFAYYAIAGHLEALTDQAIRIASTGEELPEPLSEAAAGEVCAAADDIACAVDDAVTAVLDGDGTKVPEARDRCDAAAEGIEALGGRLYDGAVSDSVPEAAALSAALAHLRETVDRGRRVTDAAASAVMRAEKIDD